MRSHRLRSPPCRTRFLQGEQLEPRLPLAAEIEPNNTAAQATVLPSSTSYLNYEVTGTLASILDVDYFKITLNAGQSMSADAYWGDARQLIGSVDILDAQGRVLSSRIGVEGARVRVTKDGDYFVRTTAPNEMGTKTGSYSLRVGMTSSTIPNSIFQSEIEPNDTFATAQHNNSPYTYLGELSSPSDLDYYSFNGWSGYSLSVNFEGFPEERPTAIVYRPDGTELARNESGTGLRVTLPTTGSYRVAVSSARDIGAIAGDYIVAIEQYGGPHTTLPPTATSLATAPIVNASSATLVGSLTQVGVPRVFGLDSTSLEYPSIYIYSPGQIRSELMNDRGQVIASAKTSSFGLAYLERPPAPGRYYVSVTPLNATAIGNLTVSVYDQTQIMDRRSTPLFFLDFDAQRPTYVGNSWVSPFGVPAAKDFIHGMVESRYSAWDVEVTRTLPLAYEYVGHGFGNFGIPGSAGQSIGGGPGFDRPEGDAVTDCNMSSWATLSYGCTTTTNHEYAHGVGLSHPRSIQNLLAYRNEEEIFPAGASYPFYLTESRVPDYFQNNTRDYLDWALTAGYQVVESSGNDTRGGAQPLSPRIDDMKVDLIRGVSDAAGGWANEVRLLNINNDNWLDLVYTEENTDKITVRLGTGPGKFNAGNRYTPGFDLPSGVSSILGTGDVNGDGREDIAVAGRTSNSVVVYLSNQDGTLAAPQVVAAGTNPRTVELVDLNGDGRADLVTGNGDGQIGVHLSNGDGTFQARQQFATTGGSVEDIQAARIDAGSTWDMVTANGSGNTLHVFFGTGTGSFGAPTSYAVTGTPQQVQLADVNGDGIRDLVTKTASQIGVLRGNAGGTFNAVAMQYFGFSPTSFTTGDFNADGYADVIIAANSNSYGMYMVPGTATGSFGTRLWQYFYGVGGLATADLNGDGYDDFVEATYNTSKITPTFGRPNDPGSDRAVVFGSISGATDKDNYSIVVAAGERYSFDIESAEFQYPLDAVISLYDAAGNLLARNDDALDRDTGIQSVDPYLVHTFTTAGTYYAEVTSKNYTAGAYRFKVSPTTAWDDDGPKVIGTLPAGQSNVRMRKQVTIFFNDQIDPATLTAANVIVSGTNTGVRSGTAVFDPFEAALIWTADSVLPIDSYTVTLRGVPGGVTDLKGNLLDGETDGSFVFPEVSGNDTPGGNFTFTFGVNAVDNIPATATVTYSRNDYNRGQFNVSFSDEISKTFAQLTARGAGPDRIFDTADDRLLPLDTVQDLMEAYSFTAFSRGIPDPDFYRVEGTVMDAAGHNVVVSAPVRISVEVPNAALFTDSGLTQHGLVGSYVNSSLGTYAPQDDWRVTQTISGTRTDERIDFSAYSFGSRASVGVTGGSDAVWGNFSVQWDGYLQIPNAGTQLLLKSINSSRMWIDLNNDGIFDSTGPEFINNSWGGTSSQTWGGILSNVFTAAGTHKIRLQYEHSTAETHNIQLEWITPDLGGEVDGIGHGPSVIDVNVPAGATLGMGQPYAIEVYFSGAIDPATLTTNNFKLRYYFDASYSGAGTNVAENDGVIAWDPTLHKATFQTAQRLNRGYYILELNGDPGGITDTRGRPLDGEMLNSQILGNNQPMHLQDTPSGDGRMGGDYVTSFNVYNFLAEMTVVPNDVFEDGTDNIYFTLLRTGNISQEDVVHFAVGGTATFGVDYSQTGATSFTTTTGAVTFPAGATSVTVTIDPTSDTVFEADETLTLTLVTANPYYLGPAFTGTATLRNDDTRPLQVMTRTVTPSGVVLDFNRAVDTALLNLYDIEAGLLGAADLTLVGTTTGPVRGSAVLSPDAKRLTFIATTGTLPSDTYTLTLRAATDGFREPSGALLDGDENGAAGGDYSQSFTVAPPANAVTVGLPNFARGPQQAVHVPATGSGIPLTLSNGAGITSVQLQLQYNPALLNITGATIADGLPTGAYVVFFSPAPDTVTIHFISPTPLAAGARSIVNFVGSVPTSATYRSKHVLDLSSVVINGGVIPALADDALHVVAYFGDATGTGTYSSQDASRIARLAVGLDGGLQPFRLLDPVILADLSGNAALSSTDTSRMLQVAVGLPVADVPALPTPAVSLVQGGPDPKLSIPSDLTAAPGDELSIPVLIDSIVDLTGTGLESADLVIYYDAASLEVTAIELGDLLGSSPGQWMIAANNDPLAGRLIVSVAGTTPLEGFFVGELVRLRGRVKDSAQSGTIAVNLAASSHQPSRFTQLNEGYLTLIPAPTDAANDPDVDGLITIIASPALTPDRPRAAVVDGQVVITGTSGDDRIFVSAVDTDQLMVRVNRTMFGRFPLTAGLSIDGLAGDDYVAVRGPWTSGQLVAASAESVERLVVAPIEPLQAARQSGNPRAAESTYRDWRPTAYDLHDLVLLQLLHESTTAEPAELGGASPRLGIGRRR